MIKRVREWIAQRLVDRRWDQYYRLSAWAMEQAAPVPGLRAWDDNKTPEEQEYVYPIRIVVSSEDHKQQVMLALRYIHDMRELNTDYHAVNTLAHMYANPDSIVVEG
jgi:hypothetical protein